MTQLIYSRCEQCGASLAGKRPGTKFCSHTCARSRHNTKMLRGAQAHDLLIAWRKNRKDSAPFGDLCRLVREWIDEDAERAREADTSTRVRNAA